MSNDWYAKKLLRPQPDRREATPPVQFAPLPQQPVFVPPPQPLQQPPGRFDIDQYWKTLDPNTEDGREGRRQALLNAPKPGAGNRAAGTCPNCGGGNFYPRNTGGIRRPDVYPAPQCYDCGYPLIQSGSVGGGGEAVWG